MRISVNWLREWLPAVPEPRELAARLTMATGVDVLQIVCGAPNARIGLKAPLATIGSRLPGGMEIRQAKLRGVESLGMLCSARELGLSEDGGGLMDAARAGARSR